MTTKMKTTKPRLTDGSTYRFWTVKAETVVCHGAAVRGFKATKIGSGEVLRAERATVLRNLIDARMKADEIRDDGETCLKCAGRMACGADGGMNCVKCGWEPEVQS